MLPIITEIANVVKDTTTIDTSAEEGERSYAKNKKRVPGEALGELSGTLICIFYRTKAVMSMAWPFRLTKKSLLIPFFRFTLAIR